MNKEETMIRRCAKDPTLTVERKISQVLIEEKRLDPRTKTVNTQTIFSITDL